MWVAGFSSAMKLRHAGTWPSSIPMCPASTGLRTYHLCVWEIFSLMWCLYSAGFSQNLFASFCFVVTVKRENRIHQTTRRFAQYFGLEFDMSLLSTRYLNTAPPIELASECEIWESRISESFTGRSVMLQCHQKQDCRPSLVIFVYLNISDGWTQL